MEQPSGVEPILESPNGAKTKGQTGQVNTILKHFNNKASPSSKTRQCAQIKSNCYVQTTKRKEKDRSKGHLNNIQVQLSLAPKMKCCNTKETHIGEIS
jgi:hypothetical protein